MKKDFLELSALNNSSRDVQQLANVHTRNCYSEGNTESNQNRAQLVLTLENEVIVIRDRRISAIYYSSWN